MKYKRKILLIDDEEDFCFFVKRNLEISGEYSVIKTTDPNKGINVAQKDSPDIILLDIMMPRKDGLKTLEVLKKNKKTMSIPIIMLTAVEDEGTKLKAAHSYCEDYVVKPVSCEMLKMKIDEVFNRNRGIKVG